MTAALIALCVFVAVVLIVGGVAYVLTLFVSKVVPDATFAQIVNLAIWIGAALIIIFYGLIPLIHALPSVG